MGIIEQDILTDGAPPPVLWEFGMSTTPPVYGPVTTERAPVAAPTPTRAAPKRERAVIFRGPSDVATIMGFAKEILTRSNIHIVNGLREGVYDDATAIAELGDTVVDSRGNLRTGVDASVVIETLVKDETSVLLGVKEAYGVIRSGAFPALIPDWCRSWSLLQHISTTYQAMNTGFQMLAHYCCAKAKLMNRPGVSKAIAAHTEGLHTQAMAIYYRATQAGPPFKI
jgi:hypothetical protein